MLKEWAWELKTEVRSVVLFSWMESGFRVCFGTGFLGLLRMKESVAWRPIFENKLDLEGFERVN